MSTWSLTTSITACCAAMLLTYLSRAAHLLVPLSLQVDQGGRQTGERRPQRLLFALTHAGRRILAPEKLRLDVDARAVQRLDRGFASHDLCLRIDELVTRETLAGERVGGVEFEQDIAGLD